MRLLKIGHIAATLTYGVLEAVMEQILARLRQAKTRQEAEACLSEMWKKAGELNLYYREKFGMDDPPAEWVELGKRIVDLQEQGIAPKEICRRLNIKRVMYLHILTEYNAYRKRAIESENRQGYTLPLGKE